MASPSRGKSPAIADRLQKEAYRFDFFQAVRLLERWFHCRAQHEPGARRHAVGYDRPPAREIVRFRAMASLSFPAGSIRELQRPETGGPPDEQLDPPLSMLVACFGLTGPSGVLPTHYTRQMLGRIRERDFALRDFLDLFNHRSISLYYRAWEKYRFPVAYERYRLAATPDQDDLFTRALYSVVGLGTEHLRGRLSIDDEAVLYYGGHFAHDGRCAQSLERMLCDYFELPVEVRQFQGQWLYLGPQDRSVLPSYEHPQGLNCRLGVNLVVGERVWDVQGKFRLRIGPLSYKQFQRFMPTGVQLQTVTEMTRLYVGPEFEFDVQPVLQAAEVPWCQLTTNPADAPRLGWNTWIHSREFDHDADDAVFTLPGA